MKCKDESLASLRGFQRRENKTTFGDEDFEFAFGQVEFQVPLSTS